jgi:hypothetical protein
MDNTNMIFKSVVVSADSKDAAIEKSPFKQCMIDATSAYTNFLEKKLGYDKNFRKTWMEKHGTKKTNKDGVEFWLRLLLLTIVRCWLRLLIFLMQSLKSGRLHLCK